jgi:prolipoprotein diacylglyceryl transferase
MTTTWIAYFPSPPRGVWHLGPLPIRAYALFIIIGIVVALLISDRRWEARGGQRGVVYDIALWAVPFGLIGGRLYHLATDWRTYFGPGGAGFGAALRIWDGGLGIWGAVALGGVGAWIGCRRRGIPLPAFADAIAPGIILAQAIGRLGNYFNQELYGRETTLPWGLEIFCRQDPAGFDKDCYGKTSIPSIVHSLDGISTGVRALVVHPTFLYELIWNVLVFAALIYLDRRFKLSHGRLFAAYVALYCVGRFWIELLRDDAATHIAGIRINSFTSTFVFIGAVVYIILATKGREEPAILRGTGPVAKEAPEPEPAPVPAAASADAVPTIAAPPGPGEDDKLVDFSEVAKSEEGVEPEVAETGTAAAAEAEVIEPETVEPQAAAATTPEVAEVAQTAPEVVEPEVAEATVAQPKIGGWLRRLRSRRQAQTLEAAEPDVAQTEAAQPEAVKPEPAEAEVAEAEVAEPEIAESEVAEPAPVAPGEVEPEGAEAQVPAEAEVAETGKAAVAEAEPAEAVVVEPVSAEPEAAAVVGAEETAPEVAAAEGAEPEVAEVDVAEPEAVEPVTAEPAEVEPEGAEPEVAEPEAVEPAFAEPDEVEPEAADVEVAEPEAVEAEAVEAADPEPAESESVESEAEEAEPEAAESEPVEPEAREEPPEPAAAEEPAEEPADSEGPVAEQADEDKAAPSSTPPTSGTPGSARERWRQRMRNLRSRSGR